MERNALALTPAGQDEAKRLVRAHRLWETYLVNQIGLSAEQIHEDAEKYEHLLTEELIDEMEAELGFPDLDPHGSPIPYQTRATRISHCSGLSKGQQGIITGRQVNESVTAQLWKLGLKADEVFEIQDKNEDTMVLIQDEKAIDVPLHLARMISIEPYSSSDLPI